MHYSRLFGIGICIEALGVMIIHRPAAVCDYVVKSAFGVDVVLCEDMLTYVAHGFSFAGQEADPLKLPVLLAVIASVFDMVPYTEGKL